MWNGLICSNDLRYLRLSSETWIAFRKVRHLEGYLYLLRYFDIYYYFFAEQKQKGDFVLSHVCSYSKAAFYFDFFLRKECLVNGGWNKLGSTSEEVCKLVNWMLSIICLVPTWIPRKKKKEPWYIGWKTTFWDGLIFRMRQMGNLM